ITGPGTHRKLIGNGHDGLIFQKRTQGFPKRPSPVGLPWIDQIESASISKQLFGNLLIKLKIQGNPKTTITRLDALVNRSGLRTSFGTYIVEDIRSIETSGGQFEAQSQRKVSILMLFQ